MSTHCAGRLSRHRLSGPFVLMVGLAAFVACPDLTLGFGTGALPGYTGGPLGFGANCSTCHEFEQGPGRAYVQGVARRYIPGRVYDLTLLIADPSRVGTGFEVSVEGSGGHAGTLTLVDETLTQFSYGNPGYVTHTSDGVADSIAAWPGGGGSYAYGVRWDAPSSVEGPVTVFLSGNATNDGTGSSGEHYYFGYASLAPASTGDADGDGDADLRDAAAFQNCMGTSVGSPLDACAYVDTDLSDAIDAADWFILAAELSGPTGTTPAGYFLADAVRGGRLYDKWWIEAELPEPTEDHPLYPNLPFQSGSTTHRCKECHGWDYKGVDGAYATGTHFTGIKGVFGTTMTPAEMFTLLAEDDGVVANGHGMRGLGLSDEDLWDVVRFTLEGVIDTDTYVNPDKSIVGDALSGNFAYEDVCLQCHGSSGDAISLGDPATLGALADDDPWETIHKIRVGAPGTSMPGSSLLHFTDQDAADVAAYCQTLPQ